MISLWSIIFRSWLKIENYIFVQLIIVNESNTKRTACCYAFTAECLSCAAGITIEEYCKKNLGVIGCESTELLEFNGVLMFV